ncbi:MAG: hypothetical protein ABIT38_08740 [Gemmatimonadaceae bacterium]
MEKRVKLGALRPRSSYFLGSFAPSMIASHFAARHRVIVAHAFSTFARVISVTLVISCTRNDARSADTMRAKSPGDESRELAVAIDRAAPTLARSEWTSSAGDARATLSAFRDPEALRLIRERLDRKARGVMANRYYFANGHLRYYESEGDFDARDSTGKALVRRKQRLVLAFDFRGTMVEGARQLDGETAPMDSAQVGGAQARALELLRQEAKAPPPDAKGKKS